MNQTAGTMLPRLAGVLAAVVACVGIVGCSALPGAGKSDLGSQYYAPDQKSQIAYEAALKQAESQAVAAQCDCCN